MPAVCTTSRQISCEATKVEAEAGNCLTWPRYFSHNQHAGISAFVSRPASETERNAKFAAVGVLVPFTYGRLGRSWLHAPSLRRLASTELNDTAQKDLEEYWDAHRLDNATSDLKKDKALAEPSSPVGGSRKSSKRRSRALSEAAGFSLRDNVLAEDHPAMSVPDFMDTFGPLAFPVYRAALLRKRILLVGPPPVQRSCNYGRRLPARQLQVQCPDCKQFTTFLSFPIYHLH